MDITNIICNFALTKQKVKQFKLILLVYILLNKPIGYVTTANDQFNRDKVLDLVKVKERVVPVGRLDMYTSGALILTNDGDFIYRVTHPKHEITKTYTVTVNGIITNEAVDNLKCGVKIDDYVTRPAKVKILKIDKEKRKEIKDALNMAINALSEPTEDTRVGEWVKNENGTYSCSECQTWLPEEQRHYVRYCLHCGAKMRK